MTIVQSCDAGVWIDGSDRWGKRESDKWPEAFQKPRSCAYCGSVHPDDLIVLLEQGWELENSTKAYKTYWNPPGYAERMRLVLSDIHGAIEGRIGDPAHVSPVPPVKGYSNHFTDEHAAKINAILAIRYAKKGGA